MNAALPTSRVLPVVLSLSPGGTERLVIEMALRLTPEFVRVVCCLDEPGPWADALRDRGIVVVSLGRRPGFHPSLGFRLAEVAARCQARILHCHHYSPFVYGCIAALRHRGAKVIFTEHGRLSDAPPSRKRRLANLVLTHIPAGIFAVSADLQRYLVAEGLSRDRVDVIYNGIEPLERVTPSQREAARRALGVDDAAFVMGTAARLDAVKDLRTLIDAVATLRILNRRIVLVILGDGPERASLEAQVRALGIEAMVRFLGHRHDVRHLLPGLDLFVNSSVSEGVSLTILEAMAASLPVVATNVGGTPEVIAEGGTGLLVAPRNPEALAGAITLLAESHARRTVMGAAGRARVEANFTIDRMVLEYTRAYSACMSA